LVQHAKAARYAALALVGPADAEDAVQEALVRGWRAWTTLRDPAAARAWLVRITINVCRDWQRGHFGTRLRLTEPLEDADLRGFTLLVSDPGASNHATALDLRNAINRLDEALRVVVVLRYYAGLDATEIGEALGIPASTARTRLSRALALLRDYLGDSGERPAISRQEGNDG
jgi:RNA polymerase sigma-70 factor (ECF subfamily)